MGDIGIISMTAFISPYIADRKIARDVHEAAKIPFIEVYVNCECLCPTPIHDLALSAHPNPGEHSADRSQMLPCHRPA